MATVKPEMSMIHRSMQLAALPEVKACQWAAQAVTHLLTFYLIAWAGQAVEPPGNVAHAGVQAATARQQGQAVFAPIHVLQWPGLCHTLHSSFHAHPVKC